PQQAGPTAPRGMTMRTLHRCSAALLAGLLAAFLGGGAETPHVWVPHLPQQKAAHEYVIPPPGPVSGRAVNHAKLAGRGRVRSDGKLAVPFLGDVDMRGKSPAALSKELAVRFKEYVVSPSVTVTVEETQPTAVSVLGEVSHPGIYTLDASAGVLQAL